MKLGWIRPFFYIARSLQEISASMKVVAICLQDEMDFRRQGQPSILGTYSDYAHDGSAVVMQTEEEIEEAQFRRARYEEMSGRFLMPWDEVPEDFQV